MTEAKGIPFNREYDLAYRTSQDVAPLIRRVVAENPGPFTFHGTGTYIVGSGKVAIIDPGPDMPEHIEAVLAAVSGEEVTHLLVTHTHRDHSPACGAVQAATGAPTYGYGPHGSGKAEQGVEVEEGGDMDFDPDVKVRHGDVLEGDGWSFECVYTPGHTSNHMCFALREQQALFSGDHVMGWNTTIVSPPDGDMTDYINSLDLLLGRDDRRYYPTHGSPIDDPRAYVSALREHRLERAEQIMACLGEGDATVMEMVRKMYTHLPEKMHGAAARAVLSTLIYLRRLGKVGVDGAETVGSRWTSRV